MGNYAARLDRIEAVIAPRHDVHVVLMLAGETDDEALARYAQQCGVAVAEVRDPVVYVRFVDAALA